MPKCKRLVPTQVGVALVISGVVAASAAAATITGDAGPDRIFGTPDADQITTLAGNDVVRARAGDDTVNGGPDFDRLWGQAGNDALHGRQGPDRLRGGLGNDTLVGDAAELGDQISRDRLWGGLGDDALLGGDGRDVLRGGGGNDRADGQGEGDFLLGGPGDDQQQGGDGDDVILANIGRDVSDGGPGNDRLYALARVDVSGPGDLAGDVVRGGIGDDRIRTRDGELDIVSCGAGADVARLDSADVIEGASTAAPDGDCERVKRAAPGPREDAPEQQPQVP